MPLREVFPLAEVSARIGEPVVVSERGYSELDLMLQSNRKSMMDIGASIGYRAKVRDPQVDLDQFADAFDDDDPKLFEYIGEYLGEITLNDIYSVDVTLADEAADYRTVAEFLIAVAYPGVLHIADVEFSNPRRPIPQEQRVREGTLYKGLGLLGVVVENCVAFARHEGLGAICLTPAAHDLVPLFESLGFVRDNNEFAELLREAGSAGPMSRPIPQGD